jgi:twinfilin
VGTQADLTPESYTAHIAHNAAPKPLSAREAEMAGIRAASGTTAYEGSRARKSHLDGAGGLKWSPEVEEAVKGLVNASETESELILMVSEQ